MPSTDAEYKEDDERPALSDTLTDDDGAIDLTDASEVRFYLRHDSSDSLVVNAQATIDSAGSGEVSYEFADGELDRTGYHRGEWEITWGDGDEQTVPNDRDLGIYVHESVEGDGVAASLAPEHELTAGTVTHTGGSSTTHTVTAVTTEQLKLFDVVVAPDADPSFDGDYAYNLEWSRIWDDSDGEVDVEIVLTWDIDPGSGNDVTVRYSIQERDL